MSDVKTEDETAVAPEPIEPPDEYEFLDPEEEVSFGPSNDPEARGWGPGWPADNAGKMATVRAGGVALSVRNEIAPLIDWLVKETTNRAYGLREGQCWGFANRPIRGSKKPSNHSWGLAVDLNSLANPMGDKLVTDMPAEVVQLWKSKNFRWGGDYTGRKDAMHYEFMGTPDDAQRLIAELGSQGGQEPQPVLRQGAKGDDVRRLQERLNAAGVACGVDGDFGPGTERAVKAFQQARSLRDDGVVGEQTWAALG